MAETDGIAYIQPYGQTILERSDRRVEPATRNVRPTRARSTSLLSDAGSTTSPNFDGLTVEGNAPFSYSGFDSKDRGARPSDGRVGRIEVTLFQRFAYRGS